MITGVPFVPLEDVVDLFDSTAEFAGNNITELYYTTLKEYLLELEVE
jgi:hypothetical protein